MIAGISEKSRVVSYLFITSQYFSNAQLLTEFSEALVIPVFRLPRLFRHVGKHPTLACNELNLVIPQLPGRL